MHKQDLMLIVYLCTLRFIFWKRIQYFLSVSVRFWWWPTISDQNHKSMSWELWKQAPIIFSVLHRWLYFIIGKHGCNVVFSFLKMLRAMIGRIVSVTRDAENRMTTVWYASFSRFMVPSDASSSQCRLTTFKTGKKK